MKPFQSRVCLVSIVVGLLVPGAEAEDITLTTYYPSPRGVYQELRTTNNTYLAMQAGAVGIGMPATVIPAGRLSIQGSLPAHGRLDIFTPAGDFVFDGGTDSVFQVINTGAAAGRTAFLAGGVERLTITNAGNVGIGTANPQGPLHVFDPTATPQASLLIERASGLGATSPRLGLVDTSLGGVTTAPAWFIDNLTDQFRIFRQPDISTPGLAFMEVTNAGNVGIGTTTPGSGVPAPLAPAAVKLDVAGSLVRIRNTGAATSQPTALVIDEDDPAGGGFDSQSGLILARQGTLHWGIGEDSNNAFDLFNAQTGRMSFYVDPVTDNFGIGTPTPTAAPSPANGVATGNLDVNDVWLRGANGGAGRWASQNVVFGGMYTIGDVCVYPNPMTGGCSCPAGFTATKLFHMDGSAALPRGTGAHEGFWCRQ